MITIEGLTHRYDGEMALDSVSLSIGSGEWVLLAGANGSGKTTLVRHLNALLEPDEGTVRVDGVDPTTDPVAARTTVGMVFQTPRDQFVSTTVGADVAFGPENLGLARAEIDRRVASALAAVDLAGRQSDRIDELSGGEQARVAIAGALAMEPAVLVLDEPFAGLDWPSRRSVLGHLDALSEGGTTLLVVTHDVRDLLERADRVVGLEDGQVAIDAPPVEAMDRLAQIDVRVPE